jgi:hypothetical protein
MSPAGEHDCHEQQEDETVAMVPIPCSQLTIDRLQSAAFEFIVEGLSHW